MIMRMSPSKKLHGVFYPSEVNEMRAELARGGTANETKADREHRAFAIIRHATTEQSHVPAPHLAKLNAK
jgi:hypothetical protein